MEDLIQGVNYLTSELEEHKMRIKALESHREGYNELNDILLTKDVCDFAKVSLRTLYRAIENKDIISSKGVDGVWRFHRQDVIYWIKRRSKIKK